MQSLHPPLIQADKLKNDLSTLRNEYSGHPLRRDQVPDVPADLFGRWMEEALEAGCNEPTAMTLSTTDSSGGVTSRIVLLKGADENGFVFFTHYESAKSLAIGENPRVSALFFWPELWRQVRIEGIATRLDPSASDHYFASRPRGSQLAAWISPQSRQITSREELEKAFRAQEKRFAGSGSIPRPPFWGGYRIVPHRMEFWQGRENRLHDRIRYEKEDHAWKTERLAP